jgi:hypothetical protein
MTTAAKTRWRIVFDDPNWFVEKNGRTLYVGTYEECEDYIVANKAAGDRVTRIEKDGYEWDLTHHLR